MESLEYIIVKDNLNNDYKIPIMNRIEAGGGLTRFRIDNHVNFSTSDTENKDFLCNTFMFSTATVDTHTDNFIISNKIAIELIPSAMLLKVTNIDVLKEIYIGYGNQRQSLYDFYNIITMTYTGDAQAGRIGKKYLIDTFSSHELILFKSLDGLILICIKFRFTNGETSSPGFKHWEFERLTLGVSAVESYRHNRTNKYLWYS